MAFGCALSVLEAPAGLFVFSSQEHYDGLSKHVNKIKIMLARKDG
jgi:hypothetical protein